MKKTILVIAIIFSLFSCSKDDEQSVEPTKVNHFTYILNGVTTTINENNSTQTYILGIKNASDINNVSELRSINTIFKDANGQNSIMLAIPTSSMYYMRTGEVFNTANLSIGNAASNSPYYTSNLNNIKITITSWDGTTVKGTFSGSVVQATVPQNNNQITVSGEFVTNKFN